MNIVIRADASIEIGTGHVMRCLTLAKQLKQIGAKITFICRNFDGNNISYIKSQGFNVYTLSEVKTQNHFKWVEENWLQDAEETRTIINKIGQDIDLLIVDHYSLDQKWEKALRASVKHIMLIDDLANRVHDCDIILDQNFYFNMYQRYEGLVSKSCIQLLGPSYALLREEFLSIDPRKIRRNGKVKNVLVFFGGTDPTGETLKTVKAIQKFNYPLIHFDIVVGATNPRKYEIKKICEEIENVDYYCQVDNMAELMVKADLAIGAGGSTTWERCYLKLPTITIIIAENQLEISQSLASKGAIILLGKSNYVTEYAIQKSIEEAINSQQKLVEISLNCLEIINPVKIQKKEIVSILEKLL